MSFRCINAFEHAGVIYPGGALVEDGDPITGSHREFFARVEDSRANTETATAAPGESRDVGPARKVSAGAVKRTASKLHNKSEHKSEEEE